MTLAAPIILLPTNGADYTTDIELQTLSGTTSPDSREILINGSTYGVTYTPGDTIWAWTGTLIVGVNSVDVTAIEKTTNLPSLPTHINITLIQTTSFITVTPPTGVKLQSYQDKIAILNAQNTEVQTLGYNYYVSTQSGGINGTYARINTKLVTDYSFFENNVTPIKTSTDTAGNIRVTTITEELTKVYYYSQDFNNDILQTLIASGQLPSVSFSEDTPFFFAVSAQIYDPVLGQVTESAFSTELQGSPVTITTGIQDLPSRTQSDIILTFSKEMLAADPGINTQPGTVVRDIMDPVSEEIARSYVIQNFLSKAMSVSSLLAFDDANSDTISDDVADSPQKQALGLSLGLTSATDIQNVIDGQFDKLASNVDVRRKGATAATGTVTFYLTANPVRDMVINEGGMVSSEGNIDQGIPSQTYRLLETKILTQVNRNQFYNPQTGRYELTADVQCIRAGSDGNTDSYTITTVSSGVDSDFQVENSQPISFGQDVESNYDLSTRIELALFADTGTKGGYIKTAAGVQGVRRVNVQAAGDPLMIRDYDATRKTHVGGKVDVYIQGERTKQVTDQIAFSFESIGGQGAQIGENFPVINAPAFEFKSQNPRVSAHTPIFDVTQVHNATRLQDYDLAGYQIIGDGDTIKLDETLPKNAAIGLASADVIQVDYKFRSSDVFVLKNQPVIDIVSVVGQLSGPLTTANYEIVSLQDPLAEGGSTIASDGVRIMFANNLPLTEFQILTDELHTMILEKPESLDFIGADPESLLIKNTIKTVTYQENVDYRIIPGTDTVATQVLLIETGSIANGQDVLISYTAIENFIITYTTNSILGDVQTEIDKMKHACADAIVKGATVNQVGITMKVLPKATVTNLPLLQSKIQTALSNYVSQLSIGTSLTQSEVIHITQSIADVDYVVIPLTRMVKSDGSLIVRDNIGRTQFEIFNEGLSRSYITVVPVLTYSTVANGGSENYFRGVFENDLPLVLQSDPLDVSGGPGRAYIQADGKIVVSTKDGLLPDTKNYQAAYYVSGETGSKDINVAQTEYLTVNVVFS